MIIPKQHQLKILLLFIILFSLIFSVLYLYKPYVQAMSAKSCILMDGYSGRILYGSNYNIKLPMASTTKIMTAILAIESGKLQEEVEITRDMINVEGSSIWLAEGEVLKLEELVYGLMLNSGNDAATAIAYHISGSVEKFAELMTQKAHEIGALNTSFKNPHGLKATDHYTTAYDLALITKYGYKLPKFKQISSSKTHKIPYEGGSGVRYLKNHNKLLWNYKDCVGGKTGFTKEAGRCLVSAAERNDMLLIAVTLNDPNDWFDHTGMLDHGFSKYNIRQYISKDELIFQEIDGVPLKLQVEEDLKIALQEHEERKVNIKYDVEPIWKQIANKKTEEKKVVGKVSLEFSGQRLSSSNLILLESPDNNDIAIRENFITRFFNRMINLFFTTNKE